MTRWLTRTLCVLALFTNLCPLAVNAQVVEDRVAFIIGNGGYPKSLALKNPLNDATAIEKQLSGLGFETKSYKDLKVAEVAGLRQQMESRLKRSSVLFFYYAGHGVQIDGRNYLLPVDATLNDGDKASQESLYLGDVLHAIERMRPKIAVVILDACRDNPFKDQKNSTGAKQGLARVDPPTSTVVFYATRPGGTAQDGEDENGVFTKALLQEMIKPEQPLEVVFRRVSTSVYKSTKSEQEPWIEGVIREEFVISNSFVKPSVQFAAISESPQSPLIVPVADKADLQKSPENLITSNSNQPSVPSPLTSSQTSDSLLSYSQPTKPVSYEVALRSLKNILNEDKQDINTIFSCKSGECVPYKEWAKELRNIAEVDQLKKAFEGVSKNSTITACEFDLDSNACVREDLKITIINPLSPISTHFLDGMKLTAAKVTNSGGISFQGNTRVGVKFFGMSKNYISCAENSGRLEFLSDRAELNLSRDYCLALVPVPVTAKLNLNVLLSDPLKKQFIVKWDWGMVALMGAGSGKGLAKITIE